MGRFVCKIISFFILYLFPVCFCSAKYEPQCNKPSSCGQILNISPPFVLKGHQTPRHCGKPIYQLECDKNNNTILYSYKGHIKHYVLAINYHNSTIRVVDAALFDNKYNCSSLPSASISSYNFLLFVDPLQNITTSVLYLSCENPIHHSSLYVDTRPCIDGSRYNSHSYVMLGYRSVSQVPESCRIEMVVKSSSPIINKTNLSYVDIHRELYYGFELRYWEYDALRLVVLRFGIIGAYGLLVVGVLMIVLLVCAKHLLGTPLVVAFLIYRFRRRHLSMYDMVEDYLQSSNNLMPIKYSFSEIKKITKEFKNKLGEGGYGSVYKGKLRSGRVVAVKVLEKSKCNGQEFINEVATIGRIHHANVVQLIGLCAERSKRALVYEFMTNGSLEKYVFSEESSTSLSCEKMFEISIGVARGIEYLHRGCDKQILHFDIKPHNILLDENFSPKVSDFGLAKLYPVEDSIVSLTGARGTMAYMAPELFYKNIGGVSYKADVYSFGMLLMEMAGRRKNLNLNMLAEHSSQIYFPSWVYEQVSLGKEIEIGETTTEEKETVKKMMMVSLWCIQMKPSERPSMHKVVEMLENDAQRLQMPPKPFLSLQEMRKADDKINIRPSPNLSSDRS